MFLSLCHICRPLLQALNYEVLLFYFKIIGKKRSSGDKTPIDIQKLLYIYETDSEVL
jgi:hypothetical protein